MISKSPGTKRAAFRRDSQYEVVIRNLEEKGLLSTPLVKQSSVPEDLNSRLLFPHEPSREPTIYHTVNCHQP
jgi:hypothetical protein